MTLIVELGNGLRDSEAYCSTAFVDAYLTARNRSTENSWDSQSATIKEAHVRAATQYIDQRWGGKFKGQRRFAYAGRAAIAEILWSGLPVADETLTIGEKTYTFVASLSDFVENQVLIGASASEMATNLAAAINGGSTSGTNYSSLTTANVSVVATVQDDTVSVRLQASNYGAEGNDTPLTDVSAVTNLSETSGFVGGNDYGAQALEFPRSGLYDASGYKVDGIPTRLKQACAEYAVRSLGSSLFRDPTVDDTGRVVIRDKVGPLETEYADGTALTTLIKPYPAADTMLADYVKSGGVVR